MTGTVPDRFLLPCVAPDAPRPVELDRFVARVNALNPGGAAPAVARARVLAAVRSVAARLDPAGCDGATAGYARCPLHEDPSGWSLAAIVLRPGQSTPAHDHGAWGGAITVRGLERDRRFAAAGGEPVLVQERDYPPGSGYLFAAEDVHQPVGADPNGTTVSLHFLARPDQGRAQHHHESRSPALQGAH
jgi:predicted metal-dependent enzyme (double-stranded beta helix superfamily)